MKALDFVPESVLCIVPHPDDVAGHFGGIVNQWIEQGVQVRCLVLTNGCQGSAGTQLSSRELGRIRRQEEIAAGSVLGIDPDDIWFADLRDGALADTAGSHQALLRETVRSIRRARPDTVLTLDPTPDYFQTHDVINHRDHRATGRAALTAVHDLAHRPSFLSELTTRRGGGERLVPHRVSRILLSTLIDNPRYLADITSVSDVKHKAVAQHTTQGGRALANIVAGWDAAVGRLAGVDFAEGFNGLILR